MTVVKGSCILCGEVELTPADITLNVSTAMPDRSHYCFDCPRCAERNIKPADDNVIRLLVTGGIPKTLWNPPTHPESPPSLSERKPLSEDDLIVFGLLLMGTDELARWAGVPQ